LTALTTFTLAATPSRGLSAAGTPFCDEAVERAIEKGVQFLWSQQQDDGSWPSDRFYAFRWHVGPSALAAFALIESGVNPQDERMARALTWLAEQKLNMTYELGIRANVWPRANRLTNGKFTRVFKEDVRALYEGSVGGAYTYECPSPSYRTDGKWDNSNSQYGLLGVWAGAQTDMEVPRRYWEMAMEHWRRRQNRDGGWGYSRKKRNQSYGAMTAAGLASLFVCFDNLHASQFADCNVSNGFAPIAKGLAWFEKNLARSLGEKINYYYVFGVERVGLASGYKYFGTVDWYRTIAAQLLRAQDEDGSWHSHNEHSGNDLTATAYAILFLVRGRQAVLFNKLEFDGDWNNRPRDLANLCRWLTRKFEKTVHWQIINLRADVHEWHDAPLLYISGCHAIRLTDEHLEKLRQFVWQGGTIFSVTECGGRGFRRRIRRVYGKLFPQYELRACGREHELYGVHFELRGRPILYVLSNGVRPFVIHTDVDLARSWQRRAYTSETWAFEAAANAFLYATDKGRLHWRGASPWPQRPEAVGGETIRLARLSYSGNCDPEPLAYERFSRLMAKAKIADVRILGPMPIRGLAASGARVASLTGTGTFSLTREETEALRAFVAGGGLLVIDAAGGAKAFADAAGDMLAGMYGRGALRYLATTSPLPARKGAVITKVRYRRKTEHRLLRKKTPELQGILVSGRIGVILSREDITAGLLGRPMYTCDGYAPQSAFEIMRNIVLHAASSGPAAQ
jgi:hypothetical protein